MDLLNSEEISTIHLQTFIETCCVPDVVLGSGYADKKMVELIAIKRERALKTNNYDT